MHILTETEMIRHLLSFVDITLCQCYWPQWHPVPEDVKQQTSINYHFLPIIFSSLLTTPMNISNEWWKVWTVTLDLRCHESCHTQTLALWQISCHWFTMVHISSCSCQQRMSKQPQRSLRWTRERLEPLLPPICMLLALTPHLGTAQLLRTGIGKYLWPLVLAILSKKKAKT